MIPDRSDTESILVGREDVKRSIESFPPGSSGGPDGLLPQHLKDMTADSLGEPAYKLVDALVEFYNKVVLCDKVPSLAVFEVAYYQQYAIDLERVGSCCTAEAVGTA